MSGGTGNDSLFGRGGDDQYIFNLGDGNDWIHEGNGDSFGDRVVFGAGITSAMITLTVSDADADGHNNIVLGINGVKDSVTLEDVFFTSVDHNQAVEFLEFDDGTIVDLGELYSSTRYQGTAGNDSYSGTGLGEFMYGQDGDDYIFGEAGNDKLFGGEGNDELRGGWGDDVHYGGDGNDLIAAFYGNDLLDGGLGDDTLNGEQGNDTLYGRDGNDILDGGEGNDTVYAGAGDDHVRAGNGDDFYDGGDGVDTIDLTGVAQDYTLDLSAGDLTRTDGFVEKVLNFENIAAGDGAQTLTGTSTVNNIDGGAGSDVITGGAGSDTLTGGTGDDVFVFSSGDGQDVIADFLPPRDSIQVNGATLDPNALPSGVTATDLGSDVLINYGTGDTILLVNMSLAEWVNVLNNSGDDTFTGTSANETFYAGAGNDTINAGAGNDDLHGGAGDDDLRGSSGNDRYFINHDDGADIILDQSGTNDRIVFGAGITEDMLEFSISDAEGNGLNNLVISVSGTSQTITVKDAFDTNVLLVQTVDYVDFADGSSTSLAALYASKYFVGTDGNDRYLGTTLNDTMHGLAGNDFLFGSNGNDTLYGGVGNDDVLGGNGNDVHYGGDGNDFLYGWYGDDELHGGAGDDRLEGGVGHDRYYINLDDGADTIFDKDGNDRLYFGDGITRDLLEFSVSDADGNGKGNLVISFDGLAQSVTIRDAFDDIGLLTETIDNVYFANGSIITLTELYSTGYFVGTAGDDRYLGTVLDDTMHGQGGDDFIFGSNGDDTIYGGVGNDELRGGNGNDVHHGGDGNDLIDAYNGNDELRGDGGDDTLLGGDGNDQLYGGADNDRIDGGGGDDNHYGEGGDDYILGNVGADFFDGGDGNDTIDFSYSSNNFSLNLTLSNAVFASGFAMAKTHRRPYGRTNRSVHQRP